MTLHHDPNWPRAGAWIRGELEGGALGRLSIIGAPLTRGSITPARCDLAPHAVRTALDHFSPYDLQYARNLCELAVHDYGDLDVAHFTPEEAFEPVRAGIARAWRDAEAVVILGGDNSVTRPGCRARGKRHVSRESQMSRSAMLRHVDWTSGLPMCAIGWATNRSSSPTPIVSSWGSSVATR